MKGQDHAVPAEIVLAVLFSAMLHAGWNVIVKGGSEKLYESSLIALGGGAGVLPVLFFLPGPTVQSWGFLAASCCIHTTYYVMLSLAYRYTDMAYGYTIMRGAAPLLTSVLLFAAMDVRLTPGGFSGVFLLSCGILTLTVDAVRRGAFSAAGTGMALGNALVIMAYTVSDGYGARASGHAVSYVCWLHLLNAIPITAALLTKGRDYRDYVRRRWKTGMLGGLFGLGAYGISIWAMTKAPVPLVAALRESSVIFGMLFSVWLLKEKLTPARVAAVCLVAAGAICIRMLA